jgi:hypothetical protein
MSLTLFGNSRKTRSKCPIPAKRAQNAGFEQKLFKMPNLSKNFSKCGNCRGVTDRFANENKYDQCF